MTKEDEAKRKLTLSENQVHMIKFLLFSMSAGVIQTIGLVFFNEVVHLKPWQAYLIALVLSVVWNFTLNRKFTFKSAANIPKAMLKIAIYYAIFTPSSTWWTKYFTEDLGWNKYIVAAPTMIINLITEFLVTKYIVYRNQINTAVKDTYVYEKTA